MKAFVTGSSGFIGSRLVEHLKRTGHDVIGYDRRDGADILNLEQLVGRMKRYQPDAVFHLAAQSQVQPSLKNPAGDALTNVVGSINVFTAAENAGVPRVVYTGSGGTYWDQVSPYGISKAAVLDYLKLFEFSSCSLLLGNVYGPGGHGVVENMIRASASGNVPKIYGDGEQRRDFVWVGDVVVDLLTVAKSNLRGTLDYGTGQLTSINELWNLIGEGKPAEHRPALPGEVRESARPIFGLKARLTAPTELAEGIAILKEELEQDARVALLEVPSR